MEKSVTFVGAISALCTMTLAASAQTPETRPVDQGVKVNAPQLRSHHKVEKSNPKARERIEVNSNAAVPGAAPAPVPPSSPPPGDTQNFQGWAVTCLPQPADKSPRTCVARMGVLKSNEDRRPILFMSVIKTGPSATFVLQTPTGVDLRAGVRVQIGKGSVRQLTFESCEPSLCTATIPMDDAFMQELASNPTATATWIGIGVGEVRVDYALQEARNTLAYLVSK